MAKMKDFDFSLDYENYIPMGVWLFGGERSKKEIIAKLIKSKDWYSYYFNKQVIASISEFYLPNNMVDFAFVEETNFLYFCLKDRPNKIYAQIIPNVKHTDIFIQDSSVLKGMQDQGTDLKVMPSITFSEDIISLHSTIQNLYAVTVKRSRHKTDEILIFNKIAINPNVGFQASGTLKLKINLPIAWQDYKLKNDNLPISVSIIEEDLYNSTVYISGPCKPYICKGMISPDSSSLDLESISFDEKKVKIERLPFTLININKEATFYKSNIYAHRFYLSGIDSNYVYKIEIKGNMGLVEKYYDNPKHKIEYFSTCDIILSNLPGVEGIESETIKMLLGYNRKQKRLISVVKTEDEVKILPIIGGGNVPLFSEKLHKNLLAYELPSINKMIVIPDVCILAGDIETTTWFTIQLPRRLYAMSLYKDNPEIVVNANNYLS
jgi:hypothetical protein